MASSPPSDKGYTNFKSQKTIVCDRLSAQSAFINILKIPGGNAGDVLMNNGFGTAQWSPSPIPATTINVGVNPTGVAITSNSQIAYVANNNNYGVSVGNYISVLDLVNNLPLLNISSDGFNQPYTATLSTDESMVYITNSAGSTISIIDTGSNTVIGTIVGFDGPSGLAINGTTGYVNNYGAFGGVGSGNGHTISVVNLITNTITGTIDLVDLAPAAVALSPDGQILYVINYTTGAIGTGTMKMISTDSNTIIGSTITGFSGPFGLCVHPSGNGIVYVSNFGSNNFDPYGTSVSVVDTGAGSIIDTINTGIQPSGIAISQNNNSKYLYVSNYNSLYALPDFEGLVSGQGTVSVIDTTTNTLLSTTIPVGNSPGNISISPSGKNVYVSNFASNTVSVIDAFQ